MQRQPRGRPRRPRSELPGKGRNICGNSSNNVFLEKEHNGNQRKKKKVEEQAYKEVKKIRILGFI